MNRHLLFARVLIYCIAWILSYPALASNPGIDSVLASGYLRVGVTGNQPPFAMHGAAGQLMGFDIDLARSMAGAMNIEARFIEMPFDQLLPALSQKKIDVIMSGMDITLERSSAALFAGPYAMSGKSILTVKKDLTRYGDIDNLNQSTVKVLALKGSTSADFARLALPKASLVTFQDYSEAVNLLQNNDADVIVADMHVCQLMALLHTKAGLAALTRPLSLQPVGIAVHYQHRGLHNLLNNYLSSYQLLGVIKPLREKWFENIDWVKSLPNQQITF
jgi:polar amino acid transport system substrate-binding protein